MPCYYHPEREPIASCVDCGRLVCADCATVVGNQTVCRTCAERRQSARDLPPPRREHKSPLVAVLLSVVPGLGQMYNEQLLKGLVIMILYFVLILSFVGGGFVLSTSAMSLGLDRSFTEQFQFLHLRGLSFFSPFGFHRSYPSLVLAFLLVLIYCYAIFDAAITASQINRGEIVLHKPRSSGPRHRPTTATDEQLRKGAAAAMSTSEPGPGQTQTQQMDSGKKPFFQLRGKARNVSRLGWVLVIIGLILWGEMQGVPWLSIEHAWPIIPLAFGVRLLYDYRRYQEQSQLLLGLVFTVIGAYFLLASFDPIRNLFEGVMDHWPLCMVALGVYLVFSCKRERKGNDDNKQRNGES